jgi:hypothetical protein
MLAAGAVPRNHGFEPREKKATAGNCRIKKGPPIERYLSDAVGDGDWRHTVLKHHLGWRFFPPGHDQVVCSKPDPATLAAVLLSLKPLGEVLRRVRLETASSTIFPKFRTWTF